jgi:hypothetical protein
MKSPWRTLFEDRVADDWHYCLKNIDKIQLSFSRLSSLFPQSALRIASNSHIGEFPDKYCISGMVYLTRPWGILGLWGFTVTFRVTGFTTRSMSSIGTTPISTESPRTRAPVKLVRLAKFT